MNEYQKQISEALLKSIQEGRIQPHNIVLGDYVETKIESGGHQEIHNHYDTPVQPSRRGNVCTDKNARCGHVIHESFVTSSQKEPHEDAKLISTTDNLHLAFAQAIIAVQDLPYTDGQPYIREIRDHAPIEHLAAEMGVISSFNQHGEYIAFINNMSQHGLLFSRKPTNAPALSTYVNYIDSKDPDYWTHTADLDACTFNRYILMVNRIRIECQKRYILG